MHVSLACAVQSALCYVAGYCCIGIACWHVFSMHGACPAAGLQPVDKVTLLSAEAFAGTVQTYWQCACCTAD